MIGTDGMGTGGGAADDIPRAAMAFDGAAVRRLLPHRGPIALIDRVESYDPASRRIVGIRYLSQNDPLLRGHRPEVPSFPGTLLIEALAQVSGLMMNAEYHAGRGRRLDRAGDLDSLPRPPLSVLAESRIVQAAPARPGDSLRLDSRVQLQRGELFSFAVRASAGGRELASGTIMLAYPDYMSAGNP